MYDPHQWKTPEEMTKLDLEYKDKLRVTTLHRQLQVLEEVINRLHREVWAANDNVEKKYPKDRRDPWEKKQDPQKVNADCIQYEIDILISIQNDLQKELAKFNEKIKVEAVAARLKGEDV